jgi:hypothetical protein
VSCPHPCRLIRREGGSVGAQGKRSRRLSRVLDSNEPRFGEAFRCDEVHRPASRRDKKHQTKFFPLRRNYPPVAKQVLQTPALFGRRLAL